MNSRGKTAIFAILFSLFLALLSLIIIICSPLDLAPDEAHYWEWSRRLDFSYYSKGPAIAYLIRLGTMMFGDTVLGVRFAAVLMMFICSVVYYLFLSFLTTPQTALRSLILFRTSLIALSMNIFITTDPPTAFLWILFLALAYFATNGRENLWPAVFIVLGAAFLIKYTSITLLFGLFFYLLLFSRETFRKRSFYLSVLLFPLLVSPVLIWNSEHDWVNFAHNAGHLKSANTALSILNPVELMLSQWGLAGAVTFPFMFYGFFLVGRNFFKIKSLPQSARFVFALTLPLIVICVVVSLTRKVYANWPMPILLSGFLLLAVLEEAGFISKFKRYFKAAVGVNILLGLVAYSLLFDLTFGFPQNLLPTKKLYGWRELGAAVDQELVRLNLREVVTENYDVASEIAFYAPSRPRLYTAVLDDRRMNQYDIWGGWAQLKGRDLLLVFKNPESISKIQPHFQQVEIINPKLPIVSAKTDRSFLLAVGRKYDGTIPPLPLKR
jgi:4-amino-4-deoxy-L-arabinose transferase-like glycosyltransferase